MSGAPDRLVDFHTGRRSGRPITYDTAMVVQRAEELYIWADADGNGILDRNEFAEMIRSIDAVEGPGIRKARHRALFVCAWPRITGNTTQAHDARLREMRNGDDEAPPRHPWDVLGKQEDGTVYKRVLRAVVKRLMRRHDLHEGDIVTKMEWDAAVNAVTFSG